jgi:RimJ/RimL family protein N-acetyltransferase
MRTPELRTERLLLRGWRDDDLDALAPICADVETMRWVGSPEGMNREETWRHMAYLVGHWVLRGHGVWAVEERGGGQLVGRVGLLFPEAGPGSRSAGSSPGRTGAGATPPRPPALRWTGHGPSWTSPTSSV